MSVQSGQPQIRFSDKGLSDESGVSFGPKVIAVEKLTTTATGNDDFWTTPKNVFISRVFAVCKVAAGNGTTQVSLGQDGSAHSLIPYTNFSMETVNSTCLFTTGLFLAAGDTLRITVGGTPGAGGKARFLLEYFELDSMFDKHKHFSL